MEGVKVDSAKKSSGATASVSSSATGWC